MSDGICVYYMCLALQSISMVFIYPFPCTAPLTSRSYLDALALRKHVLQ